MKDIPVAWIQAGLTPEEITVLDKVWTPAPWLQHRIPPAIKAKLDAHEERVRVRLVAEYSSSPLWIARAAKDPDFWKNFSVGQHNLPDHLVPKHETDTDETAK